MSAQPAVLVADTLAAAGLERLGQSLEVTYVPEIAPDALRATVGGFDGLVVRSRTRVTAEVIAAGARLRVIGRAGVGLDTIDVAAAEARGIRVLNTPQASTVAVAELTLGLMLALARLIPTGDAALKRGEWLKKQLMGAELHGKTLGVIGLGRIGSAVVARARAFGMRALAHDPYLDPAEIAARGAEAAELDELLAASDYLAVHVPLDGGTRGLLDATRLARCKPGARLVCCARGGVVDEDALLTALDNGRIAGAALDVFSVEPPGRSRLVEHPRVIATPHIGAMTREAQDRAALDIAEQIVGVLAAVPAPGHR
jgi:D-3-phosphoglycerate dehydrogenase